MMKRNKKFGYSMIELIVYVSITGVIAILSVQAMLSITRTFAEVKAFSDIRRSGVVSMDRIIKEIRFASSIDYAGTILNSNPGKIKLNTADENGNAKTVEFHSSGNSMYFMDNGIEKGTITGSSTLLTNLIFRQSTTSKGLLVKIEMTLKDNRATSSRSENFYGSTVLRGAYSN